LLQDGTDRILSANLLGTGVADAPAPILPEIPKGWLVIAGHIEIY